MATDNSQIIENNGGLSKNNGGIEANNVGLTQRLDYRVQWLIIERQQGD